VDATLLVAAPWEERLRRVVARSGLSPEGVLARERAQMPEAEKRRRATWVVENAGSLEDLERALGEVLADIRARFGVR
jgi:dephospho-CoA kinase